MQFDFETAVPVLARTPRVLAHFEASKGKGLAELLDTFGALRAESLARLSALGLTAADLDRAGRHPVFGRVTLGVGPWKRYLRVMSGEQG